MISFKILSASLRSVSLSEKPYADLAKMSKDRIEGCRDCEFRYACYDCRSDSNNGAFDGKPWYCTYNEKEAVWENEDGFIAKLRST